MRAETATAAAAAVRALLLRHHHPHPYPHSGRRSYAVYAWGRGAEGQTGVEGGPASAAVVPRPTVLLDLHGRPVRSLAAGRASSAAVTDEGEVYTWGDGRTGLLGLGSGTAATRRVAAPQRVEALVGRAGGVAAVALADAHSLFVSREGAAFASGENKEGQLGLGTPIEVLAAQHRRAWGAAGGGGGGGNGRLREVVAAAIRGGRPSSSSSSQQPAWAQQQPSPPPLSSAWSPSSRQQQRHQQHQRHHQQQPISLRELVRGGGGGGMGGGGGGLAGLMGGMGGFAPAFAAPSPLHAGWAGAGSSAQRGGGGGAASPDGGLFAPAAGGGVGLGWDSALASGQVGHPVRVGSDAHALWGDEQEAEDDDEGAASSSSPSSLLSERVVAASASRYCSALATSSGHVWTFGSDFNGALGSARGASWQPGPRRVGGALGAAIADGGGATTVVVGGGFAVALARDGRVVVWGKIGAMGGSSAAEDGDPWQMPVHAPARRGRARTAARGGSATTTSPAAPRPPPRAVTGAAVPAWTLGGGSRACPVLPHRLTAVAAGQRHLLLSDGERVWMIGQTCDSRGRPCALAPLSSPKLLLDLGCEGGVARLRAGSHASAVVSGDGRLYVWGRLVDRGVAEEAWASAAARAAAEAAAAAVANGGVGGRRRSAGSDSDGNLAWVAAALARQRQACDFSWPGFGGDRPRLVPELVGVRDAALGGHHMLALVD
jgi:alpha-tubulin suppressor-like RCC1 family protein